MDFKVPIDQRLLRALGEIIPGADRTVAAAMPGTIAQGMLRLGLVGQVLANGGQVSLTGADQTTRTAFSNAASYGSFRLARGGQAGLAGTATGQPIRFAWNDRLLQAIHEHWPQVPKPTTHVQAAGLLADAMNRLGLTGQFLILDWQVSLTGADQTTRTAFSNAASYGSFRLARGGQAGLAGTATGQPIRFAWNDRLLQAIHEHWPQVPKPTTHVQAAGLLADAMNRLGLTGQFLILDWQVSLTGADQTTRTAFSNAASYGSFRLARGGQAGLAGTATGQPIRFAWNDRLLQAIHEHWPQVPKPTTHVQAAGLLADAMNRLGLTGQFLILDWQVSLTGADQTTRTAFSNAASYGSFRLARGGQAGLAGTATGQPIRFAWNDRLLQAIHEHWPQVPKPTTHVQAAGLLADAMNRLGLTGQFLILDWQVSLTGADQTTRTAFSNAASYGSFRLANVVR